MFAAEYMATAGKKGLGDKASRRIDAVRQTLDRLIVALVDIGERGAADLAGVDEVESRSYLGRRPGSFVLHSYKSGEWCKSREAAHEVKVKCG